MHVILDAGAGERLEIDDLGELGIGDSRSYTTESVKTAVVTRDEEGYEVELDGKTIRIGDELDAAHGHHAMKMKRIEMDGVRDLVANAIQVGYSDDLIYGAGAIPEPGTALLLGAGVLGLAGVRRRRA